jgi:putative Mg2+ transporter-C (MgtC) family protein
VNSSGALAWFGNVRDLLSGPWELLVLVIASLACGALVGIEREWQEKPAGMRTMILICVGATIFTLASLSPALGALEPARLAAQIVTGVGFLGAGAILRDRTSVVGLTTAATIWSAAALGIVVGAGYIVPGLILSLTIVATLTLGARIERRISGACRLRRVVVVYRDERGKTRPRLQRAIDERRGPTEVAEGKARADGLFDLPIAYCVAHREHRDVLAAIVEVPGVEAIDPT